MVADLGSALIQSARSPKSDPPSYQDPIPQTKDDHRKKSLDWRRSVENGDRQSLEKMIKSGLDINTSDGYGWSILHYAVSYGQLPIIEQLIGGGANVNTRDQNGVTPLHTAVASGRKSIVKVLVLNGAKTTARTGDGLSPLDIAQQNGEKEIEGLLLVVQELPADGRP